MNKLDKLELRMLTRNIVRVVSYFDDDGECPWDYVERCKDKFEAFTTVLIRHEDDGIEWADPISLGVFDSVKAAIAAIDRYDKWSDAVAYLRRGGDGFD